MKINEITVTENKWLGNLIKAINFGKNVQRLRKKRPEELEADIINRAINGAINGGNYSKGDRGFEVQYRRKPKKK